MRQRWIDTMNLKQTRLVTNDVKRLTDFYEKLTVMLFRDPDGNLVNMFAVKRAPTHE